jgi:hypothetical protein
VTSLFRKVQWWLQRRRKEEEELHEELQFHLSEETGERQADGLSADEATWAARRDLGNATLSREEVPPAQLRQMTYAMRTESDPLRYAGAARQIVHEADGRVPVTNLKTQAADIDQTINQEVVFARLSPRLRSSR